MAYTSEQYKYLLFRRLQRHLSMENPTERYYTQSFFGKLFDESITVTESAYNNFCELMDTEMQYCADNNITECSNITENMVESHQAFLIDAFAAIGIDLVIEITKVTSGDSTYTSGGNAVFTKPNGEVMTYEVRGGWVTEKNNFNINCFARTEYNYAKLSSPHYNFEAGTVFGLDEYNPMAAGPDTYWSYDADAEAMTITGDGTFVCAPTETQVGAGKYSTVILGANVSSMCLSSMFGLDVLVLFQPVDASFLLKEDNGAGSSVYYIDIYCDNIAFKNYDFPDNFTINWHELDEWDGGITKPELKGIYYNGVFLPEFRNLSRAAYPYVCIGKHSDGGYATIAYSRTMTFAKGSTTISSIYGTQCKKSVDSWDWDVSGRGQEITPIWANYDVLNADGTVGLAASAPVKDGVPLSIIAYSYNGAELDALPETTYPYVTMVSIGDGVYHLYCSGKKAVSSSGTLSADVTFSLSGAMELYETNAYNDGEWTHVDSYTNNSLTIAKDDLKWANYELKYNYVNAGGTAYTGTKIYAGQTVPAYIYG